MNIYIVFIAFKAKALFFVYVNKRKVNKNDLKVFCSQNLPGSVYGTFSWIECCSTNYKQC